MPVAVSMAVAVVVAMLTAIAIPTSRGGIGARGGYLGGTLLRREEGQQPSPRPHIHHGRAHEIRGVLLNRVLIHARAYLRQEP